ncbi:MAG: Ig-like domain-containing protein, partial [Planctomycetota bacterium]
MMSARPRLELLEKRYLLAAPQLMDDEFAMDRNDPAEVLDVLSNDSDPQSQTLRITSITQPDIGSVVLRGDDELVYVPPQGVTGETTFRYSAENENNESDDAEVTIRLTANRTDDLVGYVGGAGNQRFFGVHQLSDGTVLIAGSSDDLQWVPDGVPSGPLGGTDSLESNGSTSVGFLMHLSADLQSIHRVVYFPDGMVGNIQRIRTTEVPGQPTGDIYISGLRPFDSDTERAGYFIARLNGNFVNDVPDAVGWVFNADTPPPSNHDTLQPWDVRSDGSVVYGYGDSNHWDWAAIGILDSSGNPTTMPNWPAHWGDAGEFRGAAADYPGEISHSLIVMKSGRAGSLRSTTSEDYALLQSDENGNPGRQGRYPGDYFYSGHDSGSGPGYTGYRRNRPTNRIGDIVVDRRTDDFYYGYNTQSILPSGLPDFEPSVVAMNDAGQMKWWARLYRDFIDANGNGVYDDGETRNSTPDQYVDALAIDYSADQLAILGRAHGNNVINFWSGNEITKNPGGRGFQNRFTGTVGNIHLLWLGKYGLDDGQIYASTFMGDYQNGTTGQTAVFQEGLLSGWPDPNAGWPDLNTTRSDANELMVDADGRVYVAAWGRRSFTTSNAYQQMAKPSEGQSSWSSFIRVYSPDLSDLEYSSTLAGSFDPTSQQLGKNTSINGFYPTPSGVLVVGHHLDKDSDGVSDEMPVPTTEDLPLYATSNPQGEEALFGRLNFRDPPIPVSHIVIQQDGDQLVIRNGETSDVMQRHDWTGATTFTGTAIGERYDILIDDNLQLSLHAGAGDDEFHLPNGIPGEIDGGTGNDLIDLTFPVDDDDLSTFLAPAGPLTLLNIEMARLPMSSTLTIRPN